MINTATEAVGLALAAALTLSFMAVVAGHIGHEIFGPANKLLANQTDESHDGSLLGHLGQVLNFLPPALGGLLTGAWHEHHVAFHVTSSLMVLAVRDLPAEVWHKEGRMEGPADRVVEDF